MPRCEATTKRGSRCLNLSRNGSRFCHAHNGQIDKKALDKATLTGAGALIGNVLMPGVGGIIGGGVAGYIAGELITEEYNMKKKVFVSFDFDNDKKLKDFIIGQSRLNDSPFDVADHSLKEAAPERNWETKARQAISRSDIVVVMVGPQTHRAQGVLKEVKMARELKKQIVQVIGYKDGNYTAVPDAGRLYRWNWDNLKKLLA